MRRLAVGLAALAAAALTSGGLLVASAQEGATSAYVLTRDLPAGAPLTADALHVEQVRLGAGAAAAVGPSSRPAANRALAAHDLHAGQLLQRGDIDSGDRPRGERRAVFVPLKDVPGALPGGRVDLLSVSGPADRLSVGAVALDVEVRASAPGGLVVVVPARQAPALVLAAAALRLVAVAAEPGSGRAEEPAVTGVDQALEALRR